MRKAFIIRQIVARSFYLLPFLLALVTIPYPYQSVAVCLLIIKIKMPSETDISEISHVTSYIAFNLKAPRDGASDAWLNSLKNAFLLGEGVDVGDVELGALKIKIDLIFNAAEMLFVAVSTVALLWKSFQ